MKRRGLATQAAVAIPTERINPVYLPQLDNMARVQILYGGSSSGKSVFLAQRAVVDLLRGGRNYLVCRKVGRTLRGSVVQEVRKVITDWNLLGRFNINKTDGTVTCDNGYQIIFAGLDDVEKLKSLTPAKGVITDVWIEEATETDKADIRQLLKRQRGGDAKTKKRLTLSFNPILKSSFIYKDYFTGIGWADSQRDYYSDKLSVLKTTYKDNQFLTDEDIWDLEHETDEYYYNVYTLGNWGVLGNVIFKNWRVEDLSSMADQWTNRRHGLDFGFSSDPAAMPLTHFDKKRKTIYIYAELYERGLTNDLLAEEVKKLIGHWRDEEKTDPETGEAQTVRVCDGTDYVTCDSAEPKSIKDLRNHGVSALAAKKGKDSVSHGIVWLKEQTIVIDKKCINAQNEFQSYKWREDKDGNALREPVDKDNHLIDGLRYAYEDETNGLQIFV